MRSGFSLVAVFGAAIVMSGSAMAASPACMLKRDDTHTTSYQDNYNVSATKDGGRLVTMQEGFRRIYVTLGGELSSLYLGNNGTFHFSNFTCSKNIPFKCSKPSTLSKNYMKGIKRKVGNRMISLNAPSAEKIYVRGPSGQVFRLSKFMWNGTPYFKPVPLSVDQAAALGIQMDANLGCGGASFSGSGSTSSSSSGGGTSSSSSSGGNHDTGNTVDVDHNDQDTTPSPDAPDPDGSISLCQIAGTCGTSSSGSASSGGSSSSSGGLSSGSSSGSSSTSSTSSSGGSSTGSSSTSSGGDLTWSGAFLTSYTAPRYELNSAYALERKLGVPSRLVLMFNGQQDWNTVEGNWVLGRIKQGLERDPKVSYVDSVPLMPSVKSGAVPADRETRLTQCAQGQYNSHYITRGNRYKSMGIKNIIIRAGWESNIPSFPWGFDYRDDYGRLYAQCFAQFVRSIRSVYPDSQSGFLFDWNVQQGGLDKFNLASAYPGDQYVDIVSVDMYDAYLGDGGTGKCRGAHNGALDKSAECRVARWNAQKTRVLDKVNGFARQHGKLFALPEWGAVSTQGQDYKYISNAGGGDNPYFIQKSCEYIQDPANNVFYYTLYDHANIVSSSMTIDSSIDNKPLAAAAFRRYCKGSSSSATDAIRRLGVR